MMLNPSIPSHGVSWCYRRRNRPGRVCRTCPRVPRIRAPVPNRLPAPSKFRSATLARRAPRLAMALARSSIRYAPVGTGDSGSRPRLRCGIWLDHRNLHPISQPAQDANQQIAGQVIEVAIQNRRNSGSRSAHPFGDLGMRDPAPKDNLLRRLSSACWNCHALASAAESPMAAASSSGVLQTIGSNPGIKKPSSRGDKSPRHSP